MSDTSLRLVERDLLIDPKAAARAIGAMARRLGHEAGLALLEEVEERLVAGWKERGAAATAESICMATDRPATRDLIARSFATLALSDERMAMEREQERRTAGVA